jgi:hypothetical protein
MDAIWKFLTDPANHYAIGWGATLLCVFIAYLASRALSDSPRLFAAIAIMACAWVLVLGAYGAREARPLAYLVTDIASFLLVYIGVLLALEGGREKSPIASLLQRGAFWLLLLIVLPRQLSFPASLQLPALSVDQFEIGAGMFLAMLGFASIGIGVWTIASGWSRYAIVVVLVFYAYLNIERTVDIWWDGSDSKRMSGFFIYSFAAAKLALTSLLCYVVVQYAHGGRSVIIPAATPVHPKAQAS